MTQPPTSPADIEARLLAAWKDLTQGAEPDPDRPFFEAGGDSMLLLEFQIALAGMGLHVPYTALYEFPNIAALARELSPGGSLRA